jgi:NAD(P)-dependent dehydrogenase (short-subunit alcohol dehydrogenase family)
VHPGSLAAHASVGLGKDREHQFHRRVRTFPLLGERITRQQRLRVLGLTRHIAKEVADAGITVNAVCPGLIETAMVWNTISRERMEAYAASFPIPRLGQPAEVADLIGFLTSQGPPTSRARLSTSTVAT